MKLTVLWMSTAILTSCASRPVSSPPEHWFAKVDRASASSWEILPQEAGPGEVVLSKRTELGLLSNFAPTPFVFHGKRYASVEGFWQMMLYPETTVDGKADPRAKWELPYSREKVAGMTAFEAKSAGDVALKAMKKAGISWVSFEGKSFAYETQEKGEHYRLIVEVMRAKMEQNPAVKAILKSTGSLKLKADHHVSVSDPPAWKYYEIWEMFRASL